VTEADGDRFDTIVARLRERIADPDRRVDQRPSTFLAGIQTLDFAGLLGQLRQVGGDLRRVVELNQQGRTDPGLNLRAEELGRDMATPVEVALRPPAEPALVERVEADLGFSLPAGLRRLYLEVADGGYGPGTGLLPIELVAKRYRSVTAEVPRNQVWPERLLPLVDDEPVMDSLDASVPDGAVITWDPEDLRERSSDGDWQRSFSEAAPSLADWLETWLSSRTPEEERADMLRQAMIDGVRQSRAYFAAMTPTQRAEYGLPEEGWEEQISGGFRLPEDDQPPT